MMKSYTFRITIETKNKKTNEVDLNPLKSREEITTLLAHKQSKIKKLLLMREGGGDTKIPIHYHGIIMTNLKSIQSIRKFIKCLGEKEYKGNECYQMNNTPIEEQAKPLHAYQYTCKCNKKYYSLGYSSEDIKGYAEGFKKDKEEYIRSKKDKISAIVELCQKLKKDENWERNTIRIILMEYKRRKLLPPVGFQLRKVIGRIMMEIDIEEYIRVVQLDYTEMGFYSFDPSYVGNERLCNACGKYHDVLESCR